MACVLTRSRAEACKDVVAGIKEIYFIDFGGLGTVTTGSSDEITNMTGGSSNEISLIFLHKSKANPFHLLIEK